MKLATCLAILSFAVGCGGRDSDGKQKPDPKTTKGSAEEPDEKVDGPPKRVALTAKKLAPVIHELSVENVVPTAVVIEMATPIIDGDLVGGVTSKSVLKITPETKGRLNYSSVSGLTFTPEQPFAFNTQYTFDLQKVETRDGEIAPDANEKWTHSFKTPEFKFLGWSPTELDV